MVQRIISDRGICRPVEVSPEATINSSNNVVNRIQRLSVTESAPDGESLNPLQALKVYSNIQASVAIYHDKSGNWFQITETHPEPRRIHPSSVGVVGDLDEADTASESGLSRGLLGISRPSRPRKRKRRDSSSPVSISRKKRRPAKDSPSGTHATLHSEHEDSENTRAGMETELRQIRIDEVHVYYDKTFRMMLQLCCKEILKIWIRACHPKKQSLHPYNGGKNKDRHRTKPDYWPPDEDRNGMTKIRHTEPDHLNKHERLVLLIHLLRSEDRGFKHADFSLEKLIKSTDRIHPETATKKFTPENIERLREIYRVRFKERQYERGEIDGDTVVTVQMPKPRRNIRRAPKSAVKTANSSSKRARKEPGQSDLTIRKAPVANMCIGLQKEDENLDQSEGSEPSIPTNTSSITEDIAQDTSYGESTLHEAHTTFDSPWPEARPQNSVIEDWTLRSTNLRQNPAGFPSPSPYGSVVTPGEAQSSLPPLSQNQVGLSSMPTFYGQVTRGQSDHAASLQVPNRGHLNGTIPRSPPAWPIAAKVDNVRYPGFAASSSGLVGAYSTDSDYPDWQTEGYLNPQAGSSAYTGITGPTGSFSSGYSDANSSSGVQLDTWTDGNQSLMPPYYQSLEEEQQQRFGTQAVGIPRYQYLGMDTPSGSNPDSVHRSLQSTNLYPRNAASGMEHNFSSFP